MTKSMTGFGLSKVENGSYIIQAEVKTLNSKFLDLSVRLPKELSSFEYRIRDILSKGLIRGKASFSIELTQKEGTQNSIYNQDSFKQFFDELRLVSKGYDIKDSDIFNNVLKLPEVLQQSDEAKDIIDDKMAVDLVNDVVSKCNDFRKQEGSSLALAIKDYISAIKSGLEEIRRIEPARIESIKTKIRESLEELVGVDKVDESRFEQELIYYLEKLDINEEIVRLNNHLEYFIETLSVSESQGKKLGFISQEIGREINTIGSKANDTAIQRIVVEMKDDLEKIKEQVLNVL